MSAVRGPKENLGPSSPIPDKLYFKIGEVAQLVGVQAHVLRYWQSEIAAIRPSKSASNQRRYRYRDVEIFREVRRLLYEERYTLVGARRRILGRESPSSEKPGGSSALSSPSVTVSLPATAGSAVSESAATAYGRATGGVLGLPTRAALVRGSGATDDELARRLRRGLKDIIRLVGEDP